MFFCFLILFIPVNVFALSDTSKSSIVMDVDSGRILYQKNSHEKRLIASTTKIMTFLVAVENMDVNKKIVVGDEVLKMYGTNTYIEVGEEISIKDLLYGLILRSGNDTAVVIAKNYGSEKEFVKMMNKTAKKIGMKDTTFNNPHGLDEETKNISTAYDMALLSRYTYNKSSLYRKITNTYKYSLKTNLKSYLWYNRNKFLKEYKYAIGGKTGYTPKASKTLVSYAKKNNLTLCAVSLKDANHYDSQKSMYEALFNKYKRYEIISKNRFRVDQVYYKDKLYIKEDFYYPLTKNEVDNIKTVLKITKLKNYKNNSQVGEIVVNLDDEIIKKIPVYVKKKSKKKFFLLR